MFVGRIERLKGVGVIAAALNEFLARHPHARFRFIGPDTGSAPEGKSMRLYAQSLLRADVAGRVEFTGELCGAEVERELAGALFCVLPSLWENFSMTCCEAMAAGRTCVVGAGTGSVEVISDAGLVAERESPASLLDQMDRLYRDRGLLAELSGRAYGRIRSEYSQDRVAALRLGFYREVIENRRHRKPLAQRLATLPVQHLASLLPAIATLTGRLTGVMELRQTPGGRLLGIMNDIQQQTGHPAQVLLYGAGKHTARLLAERQVWESRGHRVVGLIDDHPRFATDPMYLDLPVRKLDQTVSEASAGQTIPPVVLSTDTYQDQFWAQTSSLRARGVQVFRLYE